MSTRVSCVLVSISICVLGGRGGNKNNRVTICGFNEYTGFCVSANCETNPSLQFAYFLFLVLMFFVTGRESRVNLLITSH